MYVTVLINWIHWKVQPIPPAENYALDFYWTIRFGCGNKIFINIHKNSLGQDIEFARVFQALGHNIVIISEKVNDTIIENILKDGIIFCDYSKIYDTVNKLMTNNKYYESRIIKNKQF